MKTITVVSGKGGVGKTSIVGSLAFLLSKKRKIVVADCDVDASNLHLILGVKNFESEKQISTNYKAFLNEEKCISCKKCLGCAFSAITWDKEKNLPKINKFLCEGCGRCEIVCPVNAIKLKKMKNATIREGQTRYGFILVSGQLKMGESGSGKIVDEVKIASEKIGERENADIMMIDSSAGIGCPIISSIRGSDFIIAATEPTPSGLSDLKRVLQIVFHFGIDCGIIINKWDLNKRFSKRIENFAKEKNIKILGRIPYNKNFVNSLVNLKTAAEYDKELEKTFQEIVKHIPLN